MIEKREQEREASERQRVKVIKNEIYVYNP